MQHKPLLLFFILIAITNCTKTTSIDVGNDISNDTNPVTDTSKTLEVGSDVSTKKDTDSATSAFRGEVWADNWSSMYVGERLVMEDSVSITTERSFNAESFTFEAKRPFLLNIVMKDFTENESGLEYIGAGNQQMGDGGYIAQITEVSSGNVVAVSNADWKCLTINTAPLDKSCERSGDPLTECTWKIEEEPTGWKSADFDDSSWVNATVHSTNDVGPKDGYDQITWDPSALLIWGTDLEIENTILCRIEVK